MITGATGQLDRTMDFPSPEHQPGELGDGNDSGIYSISQEQQKKNLRRAVTTVK